MKKILLIINFILIQNIILKSQDTDYKTNGALQFYGSILLPIIYTIKRKEDLKNLILGAGKRKSFLLFEIPIILAFSSVCFQNGIHLLTQEKKESALSKNKNNEEKNIESTALSQLFLLNLRPNCNSNINI